MKFSDYTADLKEANIEGDPKLYKKMEEIRKKLKEFKGSKDEKFILGGDLAKAMSDYLESTLKRGKVNEASGANKVTIKGLKAIQKLVQENRGNFKATFNEVFGGDSSDSIGGQLEAIMDISVDEIIDAIEDFED